MTAALVGRRVTVVLGIAIVLVLVVGAIRLAAAWAAEAAPLNVAPASATQLAADLADERARADAVTRQLEELDARSQDLAAALGQARDRVAADAANATKLKDRLATAKARLATLEGQLARARQALGSTARAPASAAAVARRSGEEHESEGEHGD
jgi:septal ring factor EnvC (AmiA/AmiB activator)